MFQAIEPRLSKRLALSAAAVLAIAGCERRAAAPHSAPVPALAPTERSGPVAPSTLGRAELLQAIAIARSAYSTGATDPSDALVGRRFAVRQAFGCAGPAQSSPEGQARWSWSAGRKSIEINLTPADWTNAPVIAGSGAAGGAQWEAVEGFWLARPWISGDGCPVPVIVPMAVEDGTTIEPVTTAPVAGLAAVFKADGSRVSRRDGRAYALTLRGDPIPEPPIGGYRLLIEGRFSSFSDGRALRCRSAGADTEPVCIAATEIDRVVIEDSTGKMLREWRTG